MVEYIPYVIWISTENWNDYDDWNEQCPGMILNRIDKRLKCPISNKNDWSRNMNVFSKVFGTRSQREVKRIMPLVEKTESYQSQMQQLTDEQFTGQKPENIRNVLQKAKHWMIFFLRHLPPYVRLPSVCLEWSITVYRSSVVSSFTRPYRRDENR